MHILYKEDIDYLNKLLNLPAKGDEQDWDLELSDPARLSEFLGTFKAYQFSLSVRKAFLALIMASYDQLLQYDPDEDDFYWVSIKELLDSEKHEHMALLKYWSLEDSMYYNEDDGFPVTPRIRAYLYQQ